MAENKPSYEEREHTRNEEIKKIFNDLFDKLNCCERDVLRIFTEEIYRQHRTLQSNFWRMIQNLAEHYGQEEDSEGRNRRYLFDPRNQSAWELCKQINKITTALPLI